MTIMRIASWNINSINVRLNHILAWIDLQKPDVLALQELKLPTDKFPTKVFTDLGYYVAVNGQKTYNGVAILSKYPIEDIEMPDSDEQHRMLAVTITPFNHHKSKNKMRIINVYVPNGESIDSEKYVYKLNWLVKYKNYLTHQLKTYPYLITLGDFNIAPHDEDVHDPTIWKDKVLFSEKEQSAFHDILKLGLLDSFRLFPQPPKIFSWWDYRMMAFRRNAGLRIDHILVSKSLERYCKESYIYKDTRGWERPSDHAPVVAQIGM